jgi:hypothetical protein
MTSFPRLSVVAVVHYGTFDAEIAGDLSGFRENSCAQFPNLFAVCLRPRLDFLHDLFGTFLPHTANAPLSRLEVFAKFAHVENGLKDVE